MHGKINQKSDANTTLKENSVDLKIQPNSVSVLAATNDKNSSDTDSSGKEGLSEKAGVDDKSLRPIDKKLGSESAAFAETLGQSVKGSSVAKKDVFLNSAKPEDVRQTLMGEVVQNVNVNALKGGGEMRLVIHPEELGEVKIKVGSKEGRIDVQISAKNEEVASIIRNGSKELENSLGSQNLSLARFEVTVSDSAVVSLDPKSSLGDHFLSQQNSHQGNMQSNSSMADDRGFTRWDNQGSQRQSSAEFLADDRLRSSSHATPVRAKQHYSSRNGSQRLDVVA
jgi:flagellar hook-length control protein FliK